jgi:HEAT repeats
MLRATSASLLFAACVMLKAAPVYAQSGDIDRLVQNLSKGDDFRIRTQAALALGASKTPRAIAPLCTALNDSNTTVRAAAAAALGKLSLGGGECLSRRLASESSDVVKSAIQKALQSAGEPEPVFGPDTKVYIAIGKTTDKTGRSGDDVNRLVRKGMMSGASQLGGVLIAPASETEAQAKKRLAGRSKVKSFYLSPRVGPPEYSGSDLIVRLEIGIFSYPDKNMIGNFPFKAMQQDVTAKNTAYEDDLIEGAGESAIQRLVQRLGQIQ